CAAISPSAPSPSSSPMSKARPSSSRRSGTSRTTRRSPSTGVWYVRPARQREVDTQGDAFFFAFPTALGALAAASEVTSALASGPIRVRMGLHTGTPRLSDEGYVGKEVHLAARIAATGHGGQTVLSKATAELVD